MRNFETDSTKKNLKKEFTNYCGLMEIISEETSLWSNVPVQAEVIFEKIFLIIIIVTKV